MKSKLTLLILIFGILTSCEKTTDVDVIVSTSGKLNYKLVDDSGKGVPNVKVSLYDILGNYATYHALIDQRTTDAEGVVDFGDLNPQTYLLRADSAIVNNVGYMVQEHVQVTTGAGKQKETKVTDFSGTLSVTVQSYNGQRLRNIGIAVVPANRFDYRSDTNYFLRVADFKVLTDDTGTVILKIPSDKEYVLYFYNSVTNAAYNNYQHVSVQKGREYKYSTYIY
ncbi:carboxypeptidase-like regulatory domain-containing protein [Sphingobacterium paludis]|nr:carboxypeptidase-like regulatory domain-containing protein [Sphingobacterium paludis]